MIVQLEGLDQELVNLHRNTQELEGQVQYAVDINNILKRQLHKANKADLQLLDTPDMGNFKNKDAA
jgi:hypothetical protein